MITAIRDRSGLTVADLILFMKLDNVSAEEERQLEAFLAAAMLQADHYCQNEFKDATGAAADIPPDVKHAVLKIAASMHEVRTDHFVEVTGIGLNPINDIDWGSRTLLNPYRRFFAV